LNEIHANVRLKIEEKVHILLIGGYRKNAFALGRPTNIGSQIGGRKEAGPLALTQ
jgi:hypothetical protein